MRLLFIAFAIACAACSSRSRYTETGIASYHSPSVFSKDSRTASGRKWWNFKSVAAHRTLALGTEVRVTNLENGKHATVEIIDRGPYIAGRIIDLSPRAARKLDMKKQGLARVRIEVR